jgi:hypothetical protein
LGGYEPAVADLVELVEDRPMEAFADPVGLRTLGLCLCVVDVLHGQVELVFVPIMTATVFGATVRERAVQRHLRLIEERHDPVVEQFLCCDWRLAVVQLAKTNLRVRVDKRLLIKSGKINPEETKVIPACMRPTTSTSLEEENRSCRPVA